MEDLIIRPYDPGDKEKVINLWLKCNLVVPQNNPGKDIERKLKVNPDWFLIGVLEGKLVATCMVGYEGHRGWINYLAVDLNHQRKGIGRQMMEKAENILKAAGCPKINLQVRETNTEVIQFYKSIGYQIEPMVNMGKRLEYDEPKQIKKSKK
jgi:ribosomal protein S18 acetylase RimI-like enzyme